MMSTLKKWVRYLANLEWTEKKQRECKFCDESNFERVAYRDDHIIAVENIRSAGDAHWLIMPRSTNAVHLRDIEALTARDIPLLQAMDEVKKELLRKHFPDAEPGDVYCGYHRGRRTLFGGIILPDIISIHHLHLHVIVRPRPILRFFKYPFWMPLMWLSDQTLLRRLKGRTTPRMNAAS